MLRRGVPPFEQHVAVVGAFEPGDDAQQRGLAAAGRAEQRDQLAFRQIERDVVDGPERAELLDDVADLDGHDSLSGVALRSVCHST
jgi:hypothetical protein